MFNSGETTMINESITDLSEKLWREYAEEDGRYSYNCVQDNPKCFFDIIADISAGGEVYKYIILYICKKMGINFEKEKLYELYNFIEREKIQLIQPKPAFSDFSDISYNSGWEKKLYASISHYVKERYDSNSPYGRYSCKGKEWKAEFARLLKQANADDIYRFVLAMNMSVTDCEQFFCEALERGPFDFSKLEEVLLYIVLKKGAGSGYLLKFDKLKSIYKVDTDVVVKSGSTVDSGIVHSRLDEILEKDDFDWFWERHDELNTYLNATIVSNRHNYTRRIRQQYNRVLNEIKHYEREYQDGISEYVVGLPEDRDTYSIDRLIKVLYGGNPAQIKKFRLDNYDETYYLNTKCFENTCLTSTISNKLDNSSYIGGNPFLQSEKGRNIMLTLVFISVAIQKQKAYDNLRDNTPLESNFTPEDYLKEFEKEADRVLFNGCGLRPFYIGNAYDRFLRLLMNCDEPLSLFAGIWNQDYHELTIKFAVENVVGRELMLKIVDAYSGEEIYSWKLKADKKRIVYALPMLPGDGRYRIEAVENENVASYVEWDLNEVDLGDARDRRRWEFQENGKYTAYDEVFDYLITININGILINRGSE